MILCRLAFLITLHGTILKPPSGVVPVTTQIATHPIDRDDAAELFDLLAIRLDGRIASVAKNVNNLSILGGNAVMMIQCGVAIGKPSSDLKKLFRIAVESYARIFQSLGPNQKGKPISREEHLLLGDLPIQVNSRVDESLQGVGNCRLGFCLAIIQGLPKPIRVFASITSEQLKKSSTTADKGLYLFFDAIASVVSETDDQLTRIDAAIPVATRGPDRWLKTVGAQTLKLMRALVNPADDFEKCLISALDAHKRYWNSSADNRRDPDGYFAYEISAICKLAIKQ